MSQMNEEARIACFHSMKQLDLSAHFDLHDASRSTAL